MGETIQRRKGLQFSSNVLANMAVFIAGFLTGVFLVPFFIDELGVEAYGLIPLATSVTSYVVVIADSMGAAMARYLTAALNNDDSKTMNRMYSTSVLGILRIVLILIPIVFFVAWFSPVLFDTAATVTHDVRILFIAVLLSMLINVSGYGFSSVLFAKNRIDYQSTVKFVQIVVQTATIVLLFYVFTPSLVCIGAAYLIAASVALLLGFILSKRVLPGTKLRKSEFDGKKFKDMATLGVWEIVDQIGVLLLLQASLIIVNPLLGASVAGKFAVVIMMISTISVFASTVNGAFTPITYTKYEEGKINEMIWICTSGAKIVGLILVMPMAFLCVFSSQIFTIWVGSEFIDLAPVLWVMMFILIGSLVMSPVIPISTAYFKVKTRGIVTIIFGIVNIILAIIFTVILEMGIMGIAVAWAISVALKSWVFIPWYHASITGTSIMTFFKPLMFSSVFFGLTATIGLIINRYFTVPASLFVIIVIFVVWAVLYVIIIMRILREDERDLIRQCLPGWIKKYVPKKIL